ncbi:MAG: type II toxin-antitoxin system VapB family antitoxin [Defluviicoccus sp.]|nr:type II toxin-antitoxin system VapB family antitoxin [Defluviicoccus sp.]
MTMTAKLFWNGRSQAVRLPKEFRMPGKEVRIRRQGAAVVLEPIADGWEWLDEIQGKFSEDFFAEGRNQPPMPPPRPGLDEAFE